MTACGLLYYEVLLHVASKSSITLHSALLHMNVCLSQISLILKRILVTAHIHQHVPKSVNMFLVHELITTSFSIVLLNE